MIVVSPRTRLYPLRFDLARVPKTHRSVLRRYFYDSQLYTQ